MITRNLKCRIGTTYAGILCAGFNWSPYLKTNIEVLKRVHNRVTKMIYECWDFNFKDRLALLNLPSLEARRTKGKGNLIHF